MKKKLLNLTIAITSISLVTSIYLATLENPTDMQQQLGTTVNTVTVAGTTAIIGLLDDEDENDRNIS